MHAPQRIARNTIYVRENIKDKNTRNTKDGKDKNEKGQRQRVLKSWS